VRHVVTLCNATQQQRAMQTLTFVVIKPHMAAVHGFSGDATKKYNIAQHMRGQNHSQRSLLLYTGLHTT
jgi:hypothetical protein